MDFMSVVDAAEELALSPERVRQLIQDGSLVAHRIGGRWLVERDSVARLASSGPRPAGRPFSALSAWALLALASGHQPEWLSGADARRLRNVLAHRGIEGLHHQLRRRAEPQPWYVHPSLVDELLAEEGIVVGGAHASGRLRSSGPVDVYVSPAVLDGLVARYRPDRKATQPNLIVRVVRGPWPFAPGEREVWPSVAAADLLDRAEDDRAVRVARELLAASSA